MTEKNKMYLSPETQVVELENESILCQSDVESAFSLGGAGTIGRGSGSDWDDNGGW